MPPKKKKTTTKRKTTATKAKKSRGSKKKAVVLSESTKKEIKIVAAIVLGVCSILSLYGMLGKAGELIAMMLTMTFGFGAYVLPFVLIILGSIILFKSKFDASTSNIVGAIMFSVAFLGIIHLPYAGQEGMIAAKSGLGGGYLGLMISQALAATVGETGASVLLSATIFISVILIFDISIRDFIQGIKDMWYSGAYEEEDEYDELEINEPKAKKKVMAKEKMKETGQEERTSLANFKFEKPKAIESNPTTTKKAAPQASKAKEEESIAGQPGTEGAKQHMNWIFPGSDLLPEDKFELFEDESVIQESAKVIEHTCLQFGVEIDMRGVNVGPTVMQYTLKPAVGVKLSRIVALEKDLALALAAKAIRIEAPIPGKSLVGIEIPVEKRLPVKMRSIIESAVYANDEDPLKMVIGRNVAGEEAIEHLNAMPHLLIAGSTGSGKSVCVNSIIVSFLYQHTPDDLKLILVDPKRVEMEAYGNLPHLLTPVITEPEKTISALRWAVSEMNRRYRVLAENRTKEIKEFNKKNPEEKMPYIVIVIDELADLMMVASKEVEALICRLAQMARAVGIHLIIATQRPSVDVITGLIKANIPARIAFTVASGTDSRTIIDQVGAEKLLGRGDMLYLAGNTGQPIRLQGVFVDNDEVIKITNEIKLNNAEPDYNTEIISPKQAVPDGIPRDAVKTGGASTGGGDGDDLEEQAVEVILDNGKASASLLQRRLSVGYARAARILDILEDRGYIGPANGAKPREILISREDMAGSEEEGQQEVQEAIEEPSEA